MAHARVGPASGDTNNDEIAFRDDLVDRKPGVGKGLTPFLGRLQIFRQAGRSFSRVGDEIRRVNLVVDIPVVLVERYFVEFPRYGFVLLVPIGSGN